MLRRFLIPMLPESAGVLNIGCGMGSDVVALREAGFDAYGLDPSRLAFDVLPDGAEKFLRVGAAEDLPFGEDKFDFACSLDVMEHVGCRDFGAIVTDETEATRIRFISSCRRLLAPGGEPLLTTSIRLCPVDPGHGPRYHWPGRLSMGGRKLGLTIPWSRKNFLASYGAVKRLVAMAGGRDRFEVVCCPTTDYPGISGGQDLLSRSITAVLRFLDLPSSGALPLRQFSLSRFAGAHDGRALKRFNDASSMLFGLTAFSAPFPARDA